MVTRKRPHGGLIGALLTLLPAAAGAQDPCPPVTIHVDNDLAGSGYSEERPENWESRDVNACARTYRYLSHTVGDGSRIGRAIWRPSVPGDGWYAVEISYRATVNRTDDAHYLLIDDQGGQREHIENQAHDGDCTRVDVGEIFCRVGGECRVVLDGNDGASAAADETIFRRTRCGDDPGPPPPPGRCDAIRNTPGYEVCRETPQTCAGVFTNGAGCVAFCAAAGMNCRARFGGEPGCMQEPDLPIDCAADNGHASDWCECEGPPAPPPDAAVPPPPPPPVDAAVVPSGPFDAAAPPGPSADAATPAVDARFPGPEGSDTGLRPSTGDARVPSGPDAPPTAADDRSDAAGNRGILLGADEGGNAESNQYDAPGCAQVPASRGASPAALLLALGALAAVSGRRWPRAARFPRRSPR